MCRKLVLNELSLLLSLEKFTLSLFKRSPLGLFLKNLPMSSLIENPYFGSFFCCSNLDLLPDRLFSLLSFRFFLLYLSLKTCLGLLCDTLDFSLALLPSILLRDSSLQLFSLFHLSISQFLLQVNLQLRFDSPSLFLFLDCFLNEIFLMIQ